jgi:putative transcriptional regulator
MWFPSEPVIRKQGFVLKPPEVGNLIRELRQLAQLTREQFAVVLGVIYSTLNRWENGHMQPSPLALRQVRSAIDQLNHSPSKALREGSEALLGKYFAEKEGL